VAKGWWAVFQQRLARLAHRTIGLRKVVTVRLIDAQVLHGLVRIGMCIASTAVRAYY
jgi:hypothetical protein